MKSFILKDIYTSRYYFLVLLAIAIIVPIFSYFSTFGAGLTFPLVFVSIMILGNLISVDQQFKWDRVANILPLNTKKIITSKYLLTTIIAIIAGTVAACSIWISHEVEANLIRPVWSIIVASILLLAAISFPASIRFGQAKGRLIMVLVFLIPWITTIQIIDKPFFKEFLKNPEGFLWLTYLYLGSAIFLSFVSYSISVKFYKKQDW